MTNLLENGLITEMPCGMNFAYVLSDNSYFLPIEYKVLQGQNDTFFVKCVRMLYNGRVQLYYLADSYKPLSGMLFGMNADAFIKIVMNLLANVIEVKNNGFLSCTNIEASFDKIFVEPSTRKVRLVYLPISEHLYEDDGEFENELRTSLIRLINGVPALFSDRTMTLAVDLANKMMPIEEILSRLKRNVVMPESDTHKKHAGLKLVEEKGHTIFSVNKSEFVLGKSTGAADGVILMHNAVSRRHCVIRKTDEGYTVTDLGSLNGTFLNKNRLQPDQPYILRNEDTLRVANVSFQVQIQ